MHNVKAKKLYLSNIIGYPYPYVYLELSWEPFPYPEIFIGNRMTGCNRCRPTGFKPRKRYKKESEVKFCE